MSNGKWIQTKESVCTRGTSGMGSLPLESHSVDLVFIEVLVYLFLH